MSRLNVRSPIPSLALLVAGILVAPVQAGGYPYPVVVERTRTPVIEAATTAGPALATLDLGAVPGTSAGDPASSAETVRPNAGTDRADSSVTASRAAAPVDTRLDAISGGQAAAGAFEAERSVRLTVSDDVAELVYERDAMRLGLDNARLQAAFLLSERRDNIFSATLLLDTRPDLVPGFRISAGTRAYAALLGAENRDVFAFGLGVSAGYALPVQVLPLELDAYAFYSPDVLAFGNADRIIDWNVDVGLRLRERLAAFAGFRFLQVDTRPGTREVDDELHIGLRWTLDTPNGADPVVFE